MKKIKVYGTGCPKCKKLAENAQKALEELKIQYELEKVTDIAEITRAGIMMTPALSVDDKVIVTGTASSVEELKKKLG